MGVKKIKTKSVKRGHSKLEILWKNWEKGFSLVSWIVEKIIVGDNFTVILSKVNFFNFNSCTKSLSSIQLV